MHYTSEGPGGAKVYWIQHGDVYLSITYLGRRKVNAYIGVSSKLPKGYLPTNSDNTPAVVKRAFNNATSGRTEFPVGGLIRVQVND